MTPKKQQGFSLLEALISLLILSISMLGLGQLQARLWRNSGELNRYTNANLLASNILTQVEIAEYITTQDFVSILEKHSDADTELSAELSLASNGSQTRNATSISWERGNRIESLALSYKPYSANTAYDAVWLNPIVMK